MRGVAVQDPQPPRQGPTRNLRCFGTAVSRHLSDGEHVDARAPHGLEEPPRHSRRVAHAVAHRGNNAARAAWTKQDGTRQAAQHETGKKNKKNKRPTASEVSEKKLQLGGAVAESIRKGAGGVLPYVCVCVWSRYIARYFMMHIQNDAS